MVYGLVRIFIYFILIILNLQNKVIPTNFTERSINKVNKYLVNIFIQTLSIPQVSQTKFNLPINNKILITQVSRIKTIFLTSLIDKMVNYYVI